ncbi:hypothetical protein [Spirulina sp. 06S082]|uniref:hypothetical protein n=1 Tax=Spirulina sp. 06S082 TaxID=3110248 RepID=UPI002B220A01|nr:hypothetical protein [Spirulina sp. 06S082]MEA5471776.1 hypothetical protein [Spirulina sp. 06S082]
MNNAIAAEELKEYLFTKIIPFLCLVPSESKLRQILDLALSVEVDQFPQDLAGNDFDLKALLRCIFADRKVSIRELNSIAELFGLREEEQRYVKDVLTKEFKQGEGELLKTLDNLLSVVDEEITQDLEIIAGKSKKDLS